jgi:hypothetical protein
MKCTLTDIAAFPPPAVPWPWRISWSHFAVPLAHRDTTHIGESIFCAKCGEYVIELGIWTRRDVWAYDVVVSDGPFCGGDYLVDLRFDDPAVALHALEHWLVKLADTCVADGSALAAITQQPEPPQTHVCRFTPPSGTSIINPSISYVRSLLWFQSAVYWLSGSGDAGVTFKDMDGHTVSELIFLLREPYGVFLQLQSTGVETLVASKGADVPGGRDEITITLCGAPLTLQKRFFVDRNTAADIVTSYITLGTGERPPHDHWCAV